MHPSQLAVSSPGETQWTVSRVCQKKELFITKI